MPKHDDPIVHVSATVRKPTGAWCYQGHGLWLAAPACAFRTPDGFGFYQGAATHRGRDGFPPYMTRRQLSNGDYLVLQPAALAWPTGDFIETGAYAERH